MVIFVLILDSILRNHRDPYAVVLYYYKNNRNNTRIASEVFPVISGKVDIN